MQIRRKLYYNGNQCWRLENGVGVDYGAGGLKFGEEENLIGQRGSTTISASGLHHQGGIDPLGA